MSPMAGFSRENQWLVHRTWLYTFPEAWIEKLFPCLTLWKLERESDWGDKTKASKSFLHTLFCHVVGVFSHNIASLMHFYCLSLDDLIT